MLKMIGALIIIGATTWAGFEASSRLSGRSRQLRSFKDALRLLDAEIMFAHSPLKEAAKKISKSLPFPASQFYYSFANKLSIKETDVKSAWKESLDEVWNFTDLKENEYEVLLQFGEHLGKSDKYTQQKHILAAVAHLEREEKDALDKQQQYEKIMRSVGVLSGLLFIILLF